MNFDLYRILESPANIVYFVEIQAETMLNSILFFLATQPSRNEPKKCTENENNFFSLDTVLISICKNNLTATVYAM